MWSVTPGIAIFILISIATVSLLISLWFEPKNYSSSRVSIFVTTVSSLAIFLTFIFYYSVVDLQQQQRKQAVIEETTRITHSVQRTFSDNISKYANIVPGFISELLPLSDLGAPPDQDNPEDDIITYVLSYQIFSVWQDIVLTNEFISIDYAALVAHALQRAKSKTLREQWAKMKVDFGQDARLFGDTVFEKAETITTLTPDAFLKAANELLDIREFRAIIGRRRKKSIFRW